MLTLALLSLLAADPAGVVNRITGKWRGQNDTPISEGQLVFPGDTLAPTVEGSRISIALYDGGTLRRPCPASAPCGGSVRIPALKASAPSGGWLDELTQYLSGSKPMPPVLLRARSAGAWTGRLVLLDQRLAGLPALVDTEGRAVSATALQRGLYVAEKERELIVAVPLAEKDTTGRRVREALALAEKWTTGDGGVDSRQLYSAVLLAALDGKK